tara:strand:- start:548 stop:1630 length:1083 start_codon:yes stop_codon:yes gene_type:complete
VAVQHHSDFNYFDNSQELRYILCIIQEEVSKYHPAKKKLALISPLFLKFIVPAILNPLSWTSELKMEALTSAQKAVLLSIGKKVLAQANQLLLEESDAVDAYLNFINRSNDAVGGMFQTAGLKVRDDDVVLCLSLLLSCLSTNWQVLEGALDCTESQREHVVKVLGKLQRRVQAAQGRHATFSDTKNIIQNAFRVRYLTDECSVQEPDMYSSTTTSVPSLTLSMNTGQVSTTQDGVLATARFFEPLVPDPLVKLLRNNAVHQNTTIWQATDRIKNTTEVKITVGQSEVRAVVTYSSCSHYHFSKGHGRLSTVCGLYSLITMLCRYFGLKILYPNAPITSAWDLQIAASNRLVPKYPEILR